MRDHPVAPAAPAFRHVNRRVDHVMGMPISLAVRGHHSRGDRADAAWDEALAFLHRVDAVFSTYRPDSKISRLGRGELPPEELTAEIVEVLDLGAAARIQSKGAFDIWRTEHGARVLDPSGVVKGWAVERAAQALEALPDTDFCLSAGGDMVCRTKVAGAPPWQIGIEDPRDQSRLVARVAVRNGAVATSGSAHRGAHIVDARSGAVPTALCSVTVVGPDLCWADIDATAAFALGPEAVTWLRTRPGRRGVVVWADGTTEVFDADGGGR